MQKNDKIQETLKKFDTNLLVCEILFIGVFILLIGRLFLVQICNLNDYKTRAKNQSSAKTTMLRGEIVDRNGIKLVSDKSTFDVFYFPDMEPDHSIDDLSKQLSGPLKMTPYELKQKMSQKHKIISLAKKINKLAAIEIKKMKLRDVSLDGNAERVYPQGSMAAHILGYYNKQAKQMAGVELVANDYLDNSDVTTQYQKTGAGDIVYTYKTDPEKTTTPLKGNTLTLTIDSAIQHLCEKSLQKMVSEKKALRGAIIVMDPRNGEILAYAVLPTYNPAQYTKATYNQLKNWTLSDVYPPGSTWKIITIASGLETGAINEFSRIPDTGKLKIGSWEIKNYDYGKRPNPGMIDLTYLFEHSSNVGSANVALMMPSEKYYAQLKKFGFGDKTGIDLPGESKGLLKSPKNWDTSDHASMGYGYGSSVNSMQMVSAVAAIANNGVRVTPHVIKYSPDELPEKVKMSQVLSPETAKIITRTLTKSIERSKAPGKLDNYYVAAKTGTAIKPNANGRGYSNKLITSMIGYLPATNPRVLIYVVVDSAQGYEIWGSTVAGPVFVEVAQQIAHLLNIPPDKISNKSEIESR